MAPPPPPLYKILGAPLIADYAFFQELSTFLLLFKFILEDKPIFRILFGDLHRWAPEVESSRTSLASRTHFEVLGLGLEASSPRKLACPRLEDSTIFWIVKILWSAWKIFWKTFFCGDCLKIFLRRPFFVFFRRALALVSLVLGLEHSCPWPRECLSSKRLSLALASDFFCVLGLEPCVLDSTSAPENLKLLRKGRVFQF